MKFLVDAQLPPALVYWLRENGHDAGHVEDAGLRNADDAEIWEHALAEEVIIVTKDEDFAGRLTQGRAAPVIVWLRVGNATNRALLQWLGQRWPQVVAQLEQGHRLVEVR